MRLKLTTIDYTKCAKFRKDMKELYGKSVLDKHNNIDRSVSMDLNLEQNQIIDEYDHIKIELDFYEDKGSKYHKK